ncbi:hypothetical protein MNV84_01644 [Leishmania braziliensis]|nr:hypothetical protein MNV84_01644 [Leishmania braziliensis]
MRQPSSRQRDGPPSRSPVGRRGIPAVVPHGSLSGDFETPPPPSRRLRSRSSPFDTAPSPPSFPPATGLGISVVSVQPCPRSRPVAQRRTMMSVGKARAVARIAPQTSRLLSSRETRLRREHISEGQPGSHSADAATPRRLLMRRFSGGVASARPPAITSAQLVELPSSSGVTPASFGIEVAGLTTDHAPRRPLGASQRSALSTSLLFTFPEATPSAPAVAGTDGPSMSGQESRTVSCTFPPTQKTTRTSLSTSSDAAPTAMASASLADSVPLLGAHFTTASGEDDEERTLGSLSASQPLSRFTAMREPSTLAASTRSPHMPSIAMHGRLIPSVTSITDSLHCSTTTDTAATPRRGSCLVWLPAGSAMDFSGCSSTTNPKSFIDERRSIHTSALIADDGAHHCQSSAEPASQGMESDGDVPAPLKAHLPSTPPLPHDPVAGHTWRAEFMTSRHAVSGALHVAHTPEKHPPRTVLPSPARTVKTSIQSQRVSARSVGTHGAPMRPPLPREGAIGGDGGTGTTLSGCDACTAVSYSPNPTRSPRASPRGTPHRVSNSSDRLRFVTPTMTATGASNSGASPRTKSPTGTLSAELTKRAIKDRRRRELYAWNEQLRLQNESSVQDAV